MAEKIENKKVKCVVLNGFTLGPKVLKRGDVVELTEHHATNFGEYKGVRKEHVYVKPLDKISKEELADLNKVDKAPTKEEKTGKNK
jgi:hypothetical protein